MLVVNHLPSVLDFGDMSLRPGNNEIDDTLWKVWTKGSAKCAGLDWHIEARLSVDITILDDDIALVVASEEDNLQLLRSWSEAEKKKGNRVDVLAAIGKQVESLE